VKTNRSIRVPFFVLVIGLALVCAGANGSSATPSFSDTKMVVVSSAAQDPSQGSDQTDLKTFTGTIAKSNGKFTLQESTVGATYVLDDQKTAKKYEGKKVLVTGTFDADKKMIHAQKIEELA